MERKYDFKKTIRKVVREFSIWILPQLVTLILTQNPEFADMSVAALISVGLKTVQDYLKHR